MGRKVRLFFEDVALHIQICGINQEKIFRDDEDILFYKDLLKDISYALHVDIHAYALNSTCIHLLCTFKQKDAPSRFMQSLGLRYVLYFNKKYARSGTVWQGRYKSSFVEDRYVLHVMHYIESMQNCSNQDEDIVKSHEMYRLLDRNSDDRRIAYKSKFLSKSLKQDMLDFIENHLNKQTITGSVEFYRKLEELMGQSLMVKKRGRPKKDKTKPKKKEKKMFEKLVVLDKEKHKSLKISPMEDLKFAKKLSFVPVLANETSMVAEMFPVVFTADETSSLVALTSLGDKNLAINEDGKYITRYVPAFLRKHPFSLANTEENSDKKVILVDEEASNVSKTKGKQLFTKDGEQTEVLKNAITFLTNYETQYVSTMEVVKIIKDSGILEDREISVGEGEDKKVLVNGFKVVNREKLNELDNEVLADWVRKGIITFIDLHLNSLSKIEILFKLASQN